MTKSIVNYFLVFILQYIQVSNFQKIFKGKLSESTII